MSVTEILASDFWAFLGRFEAEKKKKSQRRISFNEVVNVTFGKCGQLQDNRFAVGIKDREGDNKNYVKKLPVKPWMDFSDISLHADPSEMKIWLCFKRLIRCVSIDGQKLMKDDQEYLLFAFDKALFEYVDFVDSGKGHCDGTTRIFKDYEQFNNTDLITRSDLIRNLFFHYVDAHKSGEEPLTQGVVASIQENGALDVIFRDEAFNDALEKLGDRVFRESLQEIDVPLEESPLK